MFFSTLFTVLEKQAGPERTRAIREQRRSPRRPLSFLRYPCSEFLDAVDGAASEMTNLKGISYAEALRLLGMDIVATFMEGPVGRTMVSMLGGNVHRMLGGAASAYSVTFSFGERHYVRRGENEAEVHYRRELLGPEMSCGIIKKGLELSCPATVATSIESSVDSTEFVLLATWT